MTPSKDCFDLIEKFESCRLEAYLDPVGIPTIGWGHTNPTVQLGDTITQEQADQYLTMDVAEISCHVDYLVTVGLNQPQYDALVSFTYNVGPHKFQKSTMLHLINGGCFLTASLEFTKWVYAGVHELAGLVKRREAERDLFLSGTAPEGA